jgi:hypothetical protein
MKVQRYTEAHLVFVRVLYTEMTLQEVTAAFNRYFRMNVSVKQIRAMTKNHKMKSGRTGRFVKGQCSWNKGVTGYMGPNATSFKKGNRPKNWTPIGTERYETKDRYIKVKVAEPNVWKFKHRLEWEKHHGPVPKGYVIVLKDGDRENCDIDNLACISRGVLAQYNKRRGHELPPELRDVFRNVVALQVAANERQREAT